MNLKEFYNELKPLLKKCGDYEVQALINTPDSWEDGLVVDVAKLTAKKRIVIHVEQQPPKE